MKKNVFKRTLFSFLILVAVFGVLNLVSLTNPLGNVPTVFAAPPPSCGDGTCDLGETGVNCPSDCAWTSPPKPANVPNDFETSILNLTNWILGFVAMVAVLAIIWGGVTYVGSAGDENKATTGKRVITYALIGLVIAGMAYAIVNVIVTTILV